MSEKQEAQKRVAAAEKACDVVLDRMGKASNTLRGSIQVNGLGIFRDRFEVLGMLHAAKTEIEAAQKELNAVEWPVNSDYEYF